MAYLEELIKKGRGLILKQDDISKQLDAIKMLIKAEGGNPDDLNLKDSLVFVSYSDNKEGQHQFFNEEEKGFPINGRKDKQILWLFENSFNQGIKLQQLQDKYNDLKGLSTDGKEIKITNVARRLKNEGRLAVVKYNGVNKTSFWGLPSWVDDKGFKEEFRPDEELLPIQINFAEVLVGSK